MKAKFLKRSESEKSDKVKVIFEMEGSEVFALQKGEAYEIALCEAKLPNMAQSPHDLLLQAQGLISQASEGIPACDTQAIPLDVVKKLASSEKCANCYCWDRTICGNDTDMRVPSAKCINPNSPHFGEFQPIYHWCSYWRDRNEEDKEEKRGDEEVSEGDVRAGVDGEESGEQGVPVEDGSGAGTIEPQQFA